MDIDMGVMRAAQRTIEHAFVWRNQPMTSLRHSKYSIRDAQPNEFLLLGELTVNAYASLPGMPAVAEQADYYEVLRDVAKRARAPATRVFAAVSDCGELLGTVAFFADMSRYGSGEAASSISNTAGIRYLAVKPESRGSGIGRSLTAYCVDVARGLGKSTVILHTTKAMPRAWAMYQRMGFQRCPEIDFQQGTLEVFGFRLDLAAHARCSPWHRKFEYRPHSGEVNINRD
jgi:GNAT superfamily N-acetyltransferase